MALTRRVIAHSLRIITAFFSSSAVLYTASVVLVLAIFKPIQGGFQKMNYLTESRRYPFMFSHKASPHRKSDFIFSLQYFNIVTKISAATRNKLTEQNFVTLRGQAQALRGFSLYYLGYYKRAAEAYQESVRDYPESFWNNLDLGIIYFRMGDYPKSVAQLQQAEQIYLSLAQELFADPAGKSLDPKAVQSRELAFSAFPGYLKCLKLIVLSYSRQKDYSGMLKAATNAIVSQYEQRGNFFPYYAGTAAYELKNYPLAVTFLTQAITNNPQMVEAYEFLILTMNAMGQQISAQEISAHVQTLKKNKTPAFNPSRNLLDLSVDPLINNIPFLQ